MFFGINGLVSKSFSDKQTTSIKTLHDTTGFLHVEKFLCIYRILLHMKISVAIRAIIGRV